VNVLQSLILTKKEKMILTPTYHVFDLYKVHQDARLLPVKLDAPDYEMNGQKIPAVNISASQDATGKVHISLVNLEANKAIEVKTNLGDIKWSSVEGQILTSANLTDINTFENPGKIKNAPFTGAQKEGNNVVVKLPAHSIVVLELK